MAGWVYKEQLRNINDSCIQSADVARGIGDGATCDKLIGVVLETVVCRNSSQTDRTQAPDQYQEELGDSLVHWKLLSPNKRPALLSYGFVRPGGAFSPFCDTFLRFGVGDQATRLPRSQVCIAAAPSERDTQSCRSDFKTK
ncbi:MAG: hypothetical protein A2V74_05020 [Acidobacteria bacterium RBG_16_70_10]|nr:MAG: hypothetical protein A2V74_05020 [Acidobacteria bacterium RBG_16_70_10]